jgi:hypothetical protein
MRPTQISGVCFAAAVRLRTAVALELVAGQLWDAGRTRNPGLHAATRLRSRPVSNLKGPQLLSAQEGRLGLHHARGRGHTPADGPSAGRCDREPGDYSPRLMEGT